MECTRRYHVAHMYIRACSEWTMVRTAPGCVDICHVNDSYATSLHYKDETAHTYPVAPRTGSLMTV